MLVHVVCVCVVCVRVVVCLSDCLVCLCIRLRVCLVCRVFVCLCVRVVWRFVYFGVVSVSVGGLFICSVRWFCMFVRLVGLCVSVCSFVSVFLCGVVCFVCVVCLVCRVFVCSCGCLFV